MFTFFCYGYIISIVRSRFMELLGNKIKTLRINKCITQTELADHLSVTSQAVSKWERNISSPDIALLPSIARYFGITIDELLNYRLDSLTYKERFIKFMAGCRQHCCHPSWTCWNVQAGAVRSWYRRTFLFPGSPLLQWKPDLKDRRILCRLHT